MLREIRSDEFEIAHRAGFFSSLLEHLYATSRAQA